MVNIRILDDEDTGLRRRVAVLERRAHWQAVALRVVAVVGVALAGTEYIGHRRISNMGERVTTRELAIVDQTGQVLMTLATGDGGGAWLVGRAADPSGTASAADRRTLLLGVYPDGRPMLTMWRRSDELVRTKQGDIVPDVMLGIADDGHAIKHPD